MKNYDITEPWLEMMSIFEQYILDAWSETFGGDLVMEIGGDDGEVVWDDDWEDGFEIEDAVNSPDHYSKMGLDFECLDIIQMTLSPTEYRGFLKGNILKYLFRHESKNGLEDIEKMNVYATELYSLLGGE